MSDTTAATSDAPPELDLVWQPLEIRHVQLKNRIFEPPHSSQYGDANSHEFSDRQVAFFRERAKGEVGLSITETVAAARSALGSFFHIVNVWDERSIPSMARVYEAVREEGGELFIQLAAMGVQDRERMFIDQARPIWGASRIPSIAHNEQPLVMGRDEIRELVADFGQSAVNVKAAGINGAEFNGAHSYMHAQWLSPTYNKRTDAYGGTPANRCRLAIECAQSVRDRVGDDFVLGIRYSWEEWMGPGGGNTAEDSAAQLEVMARSGLFDYFNISTGGYHTIHRAIPGMEGGEDDAWLAPFSKQAKEIVGDRAKVFVANKIRDLKTAEQVLADGAADMVGMARQLLADPFTVKKTREGREREIIRCNGNNECAGRLWEHRELVCALNPVTGREASWGEGTLKDVSSNGGGKKVVVVGGGPAGMKVAAVAARRGHDVTLLEASDELGGHLKLLQRLPGLEDWSIGIDNLVREVENAGVDVRLNSQADVETIRQEEPGSVVVATGASYDVTGLSLYRPEREGIPGAELDFVLDIHTAAKRAVDDPKSLGERVLIVDEPGGHLPLALAELLVDAGVDVEILSPRLFVGEKAYRNLGMSYMFPRLKTKGVKTTPQYFVDEITADEVRVYNVWAGPDDFETRTGIDTVVLSILRASNEDLFHEAKEAFQEVARIGDAAAPRDVTAAIHDAEKLAREL